MSETARLAMGAALAAQAARIVAATANFILTVGGWLFGFVLVKVVGEGVMFGW